MPRRKKSVTVTLFISGVLIFLSCAMLCFATTNGVEEMVNAFRRETKSEAVGVVTYDHGTVEYYGEKNGLFQIGSMTKSFTGLAVQKLINEGALKESDRVSDILTGFEAYYQGVNVEITVGQLMRQTSGYTNSEKAYPSAKTGQTLASWVESISGKSLQSAPGEQYAYSNVNFNLLGAIIEEVSGMSYREYMESEILSPLGLEHTYVGEPGDKNMAQTSKETATSKEVASEEEILQGSRLFFRHAIPYHVPVREGAIPAGYFYSNLEDMGRWMEIWLGTADVPGEYQEVIREIKAELREEGAYYGGWECFKDGVIGHSGGTANYSSRIAFSEGDGVGTCVLTNLNVAASTDSLCNGILELLKGGEAGKIVSDVWTVFDMIFTVLCIFAGLAIPVCIRCRKRGMIISFGGSCFVLMISMGVIFPLIFGAGLFAILFTWASLSVAVFFGMLLMIVLITAVRCLFWKKRMVGEKNENSKETGDGGAAHGDRGISGI